MDFRFTQEQELLKSSVSDPVEQAVIPAAGDKYAQERIQFNSPIAKFQAISLRLADGASPILASYGFATEQDVQRCFRDGRILLLGGGTSEVLGDIIAHQMDM
jgi:alkylation response protein AidB-like acyl-CoA dehydrogenase